MFLTNKSIYDMRKNFWTYLNTLTNDLDTEIIHLLMHLNKMPGIATRYSCASHPEHNDNYFYINMLCTQNGFAKVRKLFIELHRLCESDFKEDLLSMAPSILKLNFSFCYDEVGFNKSVPTWTIKTYLKRPIDKRIFIENFEKAIEIIK